MDTSLIWTLRSVPSVSVLEGFDCKLIRKNKKDTQLFSLITLIKCWLVPFEAMQVNNFFAGFCLNIFLDFLDQQEKFATSAACVTKLTLAARVAFIRKILCFEVFKMSVSGAYFWPYRSRMVPHLLS